MQQRRARWIAILAVLVIPFAGLSHGAPVAAGATVREAPVTEMPPANTGDQAFPALTGRVVDNAGMLSPAARAALTQDLAAHESATGQQVVVVTVQTLGGRPIEDFGYQLGRLWRIGRAGKDDGALLIVAAAERQVRIEVGYGLEGTLTDAQSWGIIQSHMLPHFRAGDYEAGILAGTRAVLAILRGDAEPAPPPDARRTADREEAPGRSGLLFWIIVAFILLNAFGGRGGRRGRRSALPWIILGGLGGMRGGRGGGFGGGGFGGGGFSGGGGSFGGGGASGNW
jgi:uncharacterized protein